MEESDAELHQRNWGIQSFLFAFHSYSWPRNIQGYARVLNVSQSQQTRKSFVLLQKVHIRMCFLSFFIFWHFFISSVISSPFSLSRIAFLLEDYMKLIELE
jgi:hypothetical protein